MTIRVLDPTAEREITATKAAPALGNLEGKTVGILDNGKFNVHPFCDHVEDVLRKEYGVTDVVRQRKSNASAPASDEVMAHLARCDAVISAVGD
jgi:hypothetical protein